MAKIKVIEHEEATGRLKEIYDDLVYKRGKLAAVHKIQSLRPESIVKHMDLYLEIMFSKSELSRAEREMIAVVVSAANNCSYCQVHHAEALKSYWKDTDRVNHIRGEFKNANLSEKETALCVFAQQLTKFPGKDLEQVEQLKQVNLSDEAILDATLVVSYFNFVNRIVLGLGVHLESQPNGYNY